MLYSYPAPAPNLPKPPNEAWKKQYLHGARHQSEQDSTHRGNNSTRKITLLLGTCEPSFLDVAVKVLPPCRLLLRCHTRSDQMRCDGSSQWCGHTCKGHTQHHPKHNAKKQKPPLPPTSHAKTCVTFLVSGAIGSCQKSNRGRKSLIHSVIHDHTVSLIP